MARISIKKNFIDGEKLFAQQLNNNFKTIEEAVNDGNKIVWQDGTEVKFKRYVTNSIDELPIMDGSIIYDTEKGRHYIDYEGRRIQVGSAGKEVLVQEEQPTEEDNKIWIESDVVNSMGTEILNVKSDSKIMGYSANYLNDRLLKVSPTEPETGEKVWIQSSKNLIDMNASSQTKNGITITVNSDKTIKLSGTATAQTVITLTNPMNLKLPNGTYTFSLGEALPSGVSFEAWYLGASQIMYFGAGYSKQSMNIDRVLSNFRTQLVIASGTTLNHTIRYMLVKGTQAGDYEPFMYKNIFAKDDNQNYNNVYNEEELNGMLKYFGTKYLGVKDSSFDLNNLGAGESCYFDMINTPANFFASDKDVNYFVICMNNISGYGRVQIAFPHDSTDTNIYIRYRWTTWKSWRKITTSSL